MQRSHYIILILLIFTLIFSMPCLAYGLKLELKKKALHIDKERYMEVNSVCFEQNSSNDCQEFLKEDLNLLLKVHKHNKEFISSNKSSSEPEIILEYAYKIHENRLSIEPEIFLKTMMIKHILFKKLKNPIEAGVFGEEMENYIIKNFSDFNKKAYINALNNQDEDFDKYLKKLEYVNTKKIIGPTPAYQSLSYDF